jgi:hypothetical protein
VKPLTYEIVFFNRDSFEISGLSLEDCISQARRKRTKQRLDRASRGVTDAGNWWLMVSIRLVTYNVNEQGVIRDTAE